MELIRKIRMYSLATIIISFILGVMLVANPLQLAMIASEILGIIVLAMGIYDLINYFRTIGYDPYFRGSILSAVIKLVLGVYILTHLESVVAMFGYIFAIYILITSINSFEQSLILKRVGISGWLLSAILSLLVFMAGVAMLFDPFSSTATVAIYAGITLIVQSASGLYSYLQIRQISQDVLDAIGYRQKKN